MSDDPPEFQVDDPEQLSQSKRIRELLNRRTGVIDARDQAFDAMKLGQATEEQALSFYRSRVETMILDLWPAFQSEELDEGTKFLESEEIDTVIIPPPEEFSAGNLAEGETPPKPKKRTIKGLEWFINHDSVLRAEFTARSWNPPGERTIVAERALPRRTLDRALVKCMEFIAVAGIDMKIDKAKEDPLEV